MPTDELKRGRKKSPRNKTIDFSLDSDEGRKYSSLSPHEEDIALGYNIYDKMKKVGKL